MKRSFRDWIVVLFYTGVFGDWVVTDFLKTLSTDFFKEKFLDGVLLFLFFGLSLLAAILNPPKRMHGTVLDALEVVVLFLAIPLAGYGDVIDGFSLRFTTGHGGLFILIGLLIPLQLIGRLLETSAPQPGKPTELTIDEKERQDWQNRMRIYAMTICLTAAICHPLSDPLHLILVLGMGLCIVIYVKQDKWQ